MQLVSIRPVLSHATLVSPVEEGRRADSTAAVLTQLVDKEGFSTLYRGMGPVLQSLFCSNFVYFYTFHGLKRLVVGEHSAPKDLLMAITAGGCCDRHSVRQADRQSDRQTDRQTTDRLTGRRPVPVKCESRSMRP